VSFRRIIQVADGLAASEGVTRGTCGDLRVVHAPMITHTHTHTHTERDFNRQRSRGVSAVAELLVTTHYIPHTLKRRCSLTGLNSYEYMCSIAGMPWE